MRARCYILIVVLLFGFSVSAEELSSLESLLEQWLKLRKEQVSERDRWVEEKALLGDEINLLKQNRDRLKEAVNKVSSNHHDESASVSSRLVAARKRLAIFKEQLLKSNVELLKWESRLPDFIVEPFKNAFDKLKQPLGDEAGELAKRLQLQLSLMEQMAQLNQQVHSGKMEIKTESGSRIYDVVILGLSVGFGVNEQHAVIGTFSVEFPRGCQGFKGPVPPPFFISYY